MTKKILVNCDGGARGNPGPAAIGAVIKSENGKVLARLSRYIGKATNNIAEYQAVIAALSWLAQNFITQIKSDKPNIQFFLDSDLVVNQLNGLFKIKRGHLKDLFWKVRELEAEIGGNVFYTSIPRAKNSEADFLVNQALDGKN